MVGTFRILALLFIVAIARPIAQSDSYAFYDDFRSWVRQYAEEAGKNLPAVLERYRTRLKEQGVKSAEIDRRVRLIETDRETLEVEFWNRFFTNPDNRGFNPEPNQFLVNVTRGRRPGRALDVGMGQGRNALYLAQQGWEVTGIDVAERAMAVTRQAAERNGLTLRTVVAKLEARSGRPSSMLSGSSPATCVRHRTMPLRWRHRLSERSGIHSALCARFASTA
jgi:SAM-dependent methyltransferase